VSERPTPQEIAREWWALADEQTEGTNTEALYRSYGDETAKLEHQLAEAQEQFEQAIQISLSQAKRGETAERERDEALAARDRAVEALEHISEVLGTGACRVNACEGCQYEMQDAAETARATLASLTEGKPEDDDPFYLDHETPFEREVIHGESAPEKEQERCGGTKFKTSSVGGHPFFNTDLSCPGCPDCKPEKGQGR
jgi:hypothetical protein